jgi:putative oxidoreductase
VAQGLAGRNRGYQDDSWYPASKMQCDLRKKAARPMTEPAEFRRNPRNKRTDDGETQDRDAPSRLSGKTFSTSGSAMDFIVNLLILLPARIASYFAWAGPLIMRLTVGYVFMLTGWAKLNNLPQMIQNFSEWGIPFPTILTPFASGVECFGGAMLMLGLFTRIPAVMLAVVMIVAIKSAKWGDVDSLETLLGFEEATYLAAFVWLAIAGPGAASLDRLLVIGSGHRDEPI